MCIGCGLSWCVDFTPLLPFLTHSPHPHTVYPFHPSHLILTLTPHPLPLTPSPRHPKDKLALASSRLAHTDAHISTLEEDKTSLGKHLKTAENEVAKVSLACEKKLAQLQEKLAVAQRQVAESERVRGVVEEEKQELVWEKREVEGEATKVGVLLCGSFVAHMLRSFV